MTVALGGVIVPPEPAVAVTVYWTTLAAKVALTVQFAETGPVVYVDPESVPPQPVTVLMTYPDSGEMVNVAVPPELTVVLAGVIDPPEPGLAVTV